MVLDDEAAKMREQHVARLQQRLDAVSLLLARLVGEDVLLRLELHSGQSNQRQSDAIRCNKRQSEVTRLELHSG